MVKRVLPLMVVVGLVALAFPMFVAAQVGNPPEAAPWMGMAAGGRMAWRGAQRGGWLTGGVSMVDATAEVADMDVADVIAALREGQTFADLADAQAIVEVMLAARSEALAQAVVDGRLTQEQADEMAARMAEELLERTESEFAPRGAGNGYALEGTNPQDGTGYRGGNAQGRGMRRGSGAGSCLQPQF